MQFVFSSSPESLRAGLLVSLLAVWLLVGVFAYLNHYTRRRYFTIWTGAWLFYALWLTLNFVREESEPNNFIQMCQQWCVGTSAVFLFWGSLVFMGQRVRQVLLGLFMAFLLAWSYVGVYHVEEQLYATVPIFTMLGVASFRAAFCFFIYRRKRHYIGASLLAVGLALWGVYLGGYPWWDSQEILRATSFFLCGVIQLFIAVSMIILVLEEARANLHRVIEYSRSKEQTCVGLQNQVRVTEDRYRKLFEQASDAIVVTNSNLEILELNQRAKRLLVIPRFEPGTPNLRSYFEPLLLPAGKVACPQFLEQIRHQRLLTVVAPNGSNTPVEIEATSIEFEGQPACQFAFREITERVRLEQQLRQSEKLSALGQMISGIAHELNNPLAVIKGYLDLILTHHKLPESTRADLKKVAHESSRAAKLVLNFLSFAREKPAQRTEVDVNEVVQRVAELRQFDLRAAKVEVSLELRPDLPHTMADADQIQQVLVNLVNNAMQALAGLPQPPRIEMRTDRINGTIRIFVEDNGPGVPKDLEAKIFEPFFTTKEVGKGTGLGLSIAHSILAEHHGRIYYHPSRMGGAGFVIELPVLAIEGAGAGAKETQTEFLQREPKRAQQTARILVLDDERSLAEMLGQMLSACGHDCTLSHNPLEALERIEAQDFDLILSDYRMPFLDGREFYQRIAQTKPDLAARIIFLTGDVVHEETQGFLQSIGNEFITKPFRLQLVENTVARVLQAQGSHHAGEVCCVD